MVCDHKPEPNMDILRPFPEWMEAYRQFNELALHEYPVHDKSYRSALGTLDAPTVRALLVKASEYKGD